MVEEEIKVYHVLNVLNWNFLGFLDNSGKLSGSSVCKESACNAGDTGSTPGSGRSAGEGKGYPPQYSGLENSMDCIVHGVTKGRTRQRDSHFGMLGGYIQKIAQNLAKKLGQKVVGLRIRSLQLNQSKQIRSFREIMQDK